MKLHIYNKVKSAGIRMLSGCMLAFPALLAPDFGDASPCSRVRLLV